MIFGLLMRFFDSSQLYASRLASNRRGQLSFNIKSDASNRVGGTLKGIVPYGRIYMPGYEACEVLNFYTYEWLPKNTLFIPSKGRTNST